MYAYIKEDRPDTIFVKNAFKFKEQIKSMGAKWNCNTRTFSIPLNKINITKINDMGIKVSGLQDQEDDQYIIDNIKYKTNPYDHQKKLVNLFINNRKVMFLCGVGTGKSKAAIDSIVNSGANSILVVAPACTLINFQNEIKKHSYLDSLLITGTLEERKRRLDQDGFKVKIINYDVLSKLVNEIKAQKFEMIVFDEIHYLKDTRSARSKAAYKIVKDIDNRIGLTGTLISNDPCKDAFSPYKVIDPDIFGTNYFYFQSRYLIMGGHWHNGKPVNVVGYRNQDEFKKRIALNSLKFDIDDVKDLPPEINKVVNFDLKKETKKAYRQLLKDEHDDIDISSYLLQALLLQKLCGGILMEDVFSSEKMDCLLDLLGELKHKKVIVWCRFTRSIDYIQEKLSRKLRTVFVFDGRSSDKSVYQKFEDCEEPAVLISQLQMGIGWEVPSCNYSIFYELDYSRKHLVQAKGRTRRLSSDGSSSCVYLYLFSRGTIEEKIYEVLQEKDFNAEEALSYVKGGRSNGRN